MKTKKQILDQWKKHFRTTKSGLKAQYKEAKECQRFYAGDTMDYRDELTFGRGKSKSVKSVEFNRVKPYVNAVVGFMAQNRRKPDYQARVEDNESQVMYSEFLNGASDYFRANANADQHETQQDKDMMICGFGCVDTAVSEGEVNGTPTRDPNGEIIMERVHPEHVGWDPMATHPNLLDAKWVYRAKDYDLDEAMALFNADEEDFESADGDDYNNYEYNPYGGIQDKIAYEWADKTRNMVRVYFYQWYEVEPFYRISNPLKGVNNPDLFRSLAMAMSNLEVDPEEDMFNFDPAAEMLVITKQNRSKVKSVFDDFGIKFSPIKGKRKVFYTAVISGDTVFTRYKTQSQQGYTLKFKTGDRDDVNHIWNGMVSSMKEPQRYYNKALTELMLIIASNSKGGVIYEADAVESIQDFERNWVRTNAAVRVNPGALSGGKIQEKAKPQMNTGYEGIIQESAAALPAVTGVDESFFGAIGGGNETAMLQRQRIKQATTSLACYFDSIHLYQKEHARMMLSYIRLLAESSPGMLFMVSDPDGKMVLERLDPSYFADEYEVVIGEEPETPVQKEYYINNLTNIADKLLSVGDPTAKQIYAMAVKKLPMDNRDKNKLIELLQGENINPQMVQELQRRLEQFESAQTQLQMRKLAADTAYKESQTAENQARIEKTQAQTLSEIEEAEGKSLENEKMRMIPAQNINVTI